ncbi:MAG: 4Fe-4S dicluster domain-containing protein [Planctomycetota bacterium]|jgi:Fe-S-cluster-containing dehydrogenase component
MSQVTWTLDLVRCIGCETCTLACVSENNTPPVESPLEVKNLDFAVTTTYRWVVFDEGGTYPNPVRSFITSGCNHCEMPACREACPVGAISKRATDGIVLIDQLLCVGCRRCGGACPYGAPRFNKGTGKTEKCTFCVHRMGDDAGTSSLEPACVSTCVGRALDFEVAAGPATSHGPDVPPGFADPGYTNPSIRFEETGPITQEGDP